MAPPDEALLLRRCGATVFHQPHRWTYSSFGDDTEVICTGEQPVTEAAKWEEAARVCSKLAIEAGIREERLVMALQDARDLVADWASYAPAAVKEGRLADDLAHLDAILALYKTG